MRRFALLLVLLVTAGCTTASAAGPYLLPWNAENERVIGSPVPRHLAPWNAELTRSKVLERLPATATTTETTATTATTWKDYALGLAGSFLMLVLTYFGLRKPTAKLISRLIVNTLGEVLDRFERKLDDNTRDTKAVADQVLKRNGNGNGHK